MGNVYWPKLNNPGVPRTTEILLVLKKSAALRAAGRRIPGNPASWAAPFVYSGGSLMVGLVTMSG